MQRHFLNLLQLPLYFVLKYSLSLFWWASPLLYLMQWKHGRTQMHTRTHIHTHTHTHTHTADNHTSVLFYISAFISNEGPSLSLSLSDTHTHKHTHTYTYTHTMRAAVLSLLFLLSLSVNGEKALNRNIRSHQLVSFHTWIHTRTQPSTHTHTHTHTHMYLHLHTFALLR